MRKLLLRVHILNLLYALDELQLQVAPLESRWTMSTGTSATISMDHMRICKLFHSR
ncbi:hypothetical protein KP509_02G091500 [Ceratopteris richardii]|uniref:Uncharacterized protein n=1 Tax=Ceratopteris richardii TaxID=49495 RepID=A0A8T2VBN6_CERRI|nr:hypothetical protein KP509_02G091500 [Ceratopteris richardii]